MLCLVILPAVLDNRKEKMDLSMSPKRLMREPFGVFRSSATPAGLYARKKWMGTSTTARWTADYRSTVAKLYAGQAADGLWRGSGLETVRRLFGLHLTVRHPDPSIDNGLDALLDIALASESEVHSDHVPPELLRGLPFSQGPRFAILVPATLFLCAIFGRSDTPEVLALYNRTVTSMDRGHGSQEKHSQWHNLLRALVVHEQYADHHSTLRLVAWLAERQTRQGDWGPDIPFYQALNALAHLNTQGANRQTKRAFKYLFATQNGDGTWGATQRQWCTFLAVHARRSKGFI